MQPTLHDQLQCDSRTPHLPCYNAQKMTMNVPNALFCVLLLIFLAPISHKLFCNKDCHNNLINYRPWNSRKFLMKLVNSEATFLVNFLINLLFVSSSFLSVGRPDFSPSTTFVLPSLKSRHHLRTFPSFTIPLHKLLMISTGRTLWAFKKSNNRSHFTIGGTID